MDLLVRFALMFASLLVAGWIVARIPPRIAAVLWPLATVSLLPLWLENAAARGWSWFVLTKTVSVVVCCVWACLGRVGLVRGRAFGVGMFAFLAANILEAVVVDGGAGNRLAGVLVIAAMPAPSRATITAGDRPMFDYATSWTWILAYSIWNASFAFTSWSGMIFGRAVVLLGAAILGARWFGSGRWLDLRAITLGLFMVTYATWPAGVGEPLSTSAWYDERISVGLQVVAVLVALAAVVQRVRSGSATRSGAHEDLATG